MAKRIISPTRIAAVISSVFAPRDGRPTLKRPPPRGPRGPLGPFRPPERPEPRSGIWKAKVAPQRIAGLFGLITLEARPPTGAAHLSNLLTLYSVPDSGV